MGWGSPTAWAPLTIALNGVTDNQIAVSTTAIVNGTNREQFLDVSLVLGSITPGGAPFVELHLVALSHNDTNYADAAIGGATLVAALPVTTGASIKRVLFVPPRCPLLIAPGSYLAGIGNRTGQTFAGSGNDVQYRLYSPA